jgi:hypothetical protein
MLSSRPIDVTSKLEAQSKLSGLEEVAMIYIDIDGARDTMAILNIPGSCRNAFVSVDDEPSI